jgi:glycerol-3-phosphate dehydrogenase
MYDLLAGFSNVRRHHVLSASALRESEPMLESRGLRGGALYYDCWTDDARLTLETALAAQGGGAAVINYAELIGLEKDSAGRLAAGRVRDLMTGRSIRVRARCFINVSGPWLDHIRRLDDPGAPPRLKVTKGVHAVFDRSRIGNRDAIVIRGYGDNRVMFAIPWQAQTLIGTTDTYYEGDPAAVATDADDIEYILASTNRAFPNANVTARDIISTYAGLRPLVAPEDEMDESAVSRDDQIFESPAGLLSLGGGKLTTHRHVAEHIVDMAARRLGRRVGRCRTASVPLPGAVGMVAGSVKDESPADAAEQLVSRYGALAGGVKVLARDDPEMLSPLASDLPDLRVEVVYAVEQEMALTLDDVMTRRLHLHLRSHQRVPAARQVAEIMAELLGWDDSRIQRELAQYERLSADSGDAVPTVLF